MATTAAPDSPRFSPDDQLNFKSALAAKKSIMGFMRGTRTPPTALSKTRVKELDLSLVNEKVIAQVGAVPAVDPAREPLPTTTPRKEAATRTRDIPSPVQSPKQRSMLNRFASKIRLPALPPAVTATPSHTMNSASGSAKEMRDMALRARGLLPPLPVATRPDLSHQELEHDLKLGVKPEPKSSLESTEDQPSAASVIKREWEAKNRTTMQAFRFGGNASTSSLPLSAKLEVTTSLDNAPENPISAPVASAETQSPARALPSIPPFHVQAPSLPYTDGHWDPSNIPLPPSPSPTRVDSVHAPSIKSTKSIPKSIASVARSLVSKRSNRHLEASINTDIPVSPSLLSANFSPPSPLAHSFTIPNRTEDTPAEPESSNTAVHSGVVATEQDSLPIETSRSPVSEFFTPPTSPTTASPLAASSLLAVVLPPSPSADKVLSPAQSPVDSLTVTAPRIPRTLVPISASPLAVRSRSRSTVASSSRPLPSLSETASMVSDNDSEVEYKYVPPLPSTKEHATPPKSKQRDASSRLTGLNINISNTNTGMIPVIIESPIEEGWWPVVVADSPLTNEMGVNIKPDNDDITATPELIQDTGDDDDDEEEKQNLPAGGNAASTTLAVEEKPQRRKSLGIFTRRAGAPQKTTVSSSLNSLRRSVVGTLSSKPSVPATRSAPNVRLRTSVFAPVNKGFDASHLPASPTSPTSFAPQTPLSDTASSNASSKGSSMSPGRTIGVGSRLPRAPTMHSRGSILIEASAIEDEESRRMTEMMFLG